MVDHCIHSTAPLGHGGPLYSFHSSTRSWWTTALYSFHSSTRSCWATTFIPQLRSAMADHCIHSTAPPGHGGPLHSFHSSTRSWRTSTRLRNRCRCSGLQIEMHTGSATGPCHSHCRWTLTTRFGGSRHCSGTRPHRAGTPVRPVCLPAVPTGALTRALTARCPPPAPLSLQRAGAPAARTLCGYSGDGRARHCLYRRSGREHGSLQDHGE